MTSGHLTYTTLAFNTDQTKIFLEDAIQNKVLSLHFKCGQFADNFRKILLRFLPHSNGTRHRYFFTLTEYPAHPYTVLQISASQFLHAHNKNVLHHKPAHHLLTGVLIYHKGRRTTCSNHFIVN